MKKIIALSTLSIVLAACGGEENSDTTDVNTSNQSSVVADTEITNTTTTEENTTTDVAPEKGKTTIEYFESTHDFGSVFYPSENKYTFKFKNTGNEPLVIESATASCGCTVPNKPEEPIMPGEVGELDVIFRPKNGQVGQTVNKKITVTANTTPSKETYLEISAKVMEAM